MRYNVNVKTKIHWKPPKWFNKIPQGTHGHGLVQKKLWKVVSDYVRIFDWYKYKGKCISCPRILQHWSEGQAAHFKGWTSCNGVFKFRRCNLALSCSYCNHQSSMDTGHTFGEELKVRHGKNHLEYIEQENKLLQNTKLNDIELVEITKEIIKDMQYLPEQPDYYEKILMCEDYDL